MNDINIAKLRNNRYRQSKVLGELVLQLRTLGTVIDAKWLEVIMHVCNTWGNGALHVGMRQTLNAPGTRAESAPEVNEYIQPYLEAIECEMCGVDMDTSNGYPYIGPRNTMACVGGIHCIKGNANIQEMAYKIENIIRPNPYHVKIPVARCPNDCAKGHFQDFGTIGCTKPVYDMDRCVECGACVKKCKSAATRVLSLNDKGKIDKDPCCCVGCGECVAACPAGARRRPNKEFHKIIIGGRTGEQYPRMGRMFANWLTEDSVLATMRNWLKFSEWVLGGKSAYIHDGRLTDRAGYQKFKEFTLQGVELNPEAFIAENINWAETEYRSNIRVKPLDQHEMVY